MSTEFNGNVDALFNRMEGFVTSKTVVGEPINMGGVILLPLVDVSFGVGVGAVGNETTPVKTDVDGGGIGARITPSAVIVIQNGNVQMVDVKHQDSLNKLIDMAPGVISKLNLGSFFKKDKCAKDQKNTEEAKLEEDAENVDDLEGNS